MKLRDPSHTKKCLIKNNCLIKKMLCNEAYIYHFNKPLY